MISRSELLQNHLLAALPAEELARISEGVAITPMPLGHVLYESGDEMRQLYFPTNCIISLLYVMEDGSSAEIAVVGNERIVGISLFMGGETTPSRAIVQSAGHELGRECMRLRRTSVWLYAVSVAVFVLAATFAFVLPGIGCTDCESQ